MSNALVVCEGREGMWNYHLCKEDSNSSESLCGKQTMASGSLLADWGFKPGHLPTTYCKECENISLLSDYFSEV